MHQQLYKGSWSLNWVTSISIGASYYLDDIIIFLKTLKEHLQRLREKFEKLSEAGLKLKPSKCEFFRTSLSYLGQLVYENGIEMDKRK